MPRGRRKENTDPNADATTLAPGKKEKEPKFVESEALEKEVMNILQSCPMVFTSFGIGDIKCLFKNVKEKAGKNIWVKILKEPVTLLTPKKVLFIVGADWYSDNIDSDRTKAMIEALLGIEVDPATGEFGKRDFDVQTYSDLVKNPEMDYSKFSKILPAEGNVQIATDASKIIPEDLTLTHPE